MCRTYNRGIERPSIALKPVKEKSPIQTIDEDVSDDVLAEFLENIINSGDTNEQMELSLNDLNDIIDSDNSTSNVTDQSDDSDDIHFIEEIPRRKTDLQKVCGFQTYQHVIRKAIESSPEGQMTLVEIYAWIESNVAYFRQMSDSGKAKGWKNSIRHNLSLHRQFYKVLRDNQRSCLWACDMDRVLRQVDKKVKTKKVGQSQESTFRPRSKTEPVMIKPSKVAKLPSHFQSQSYESLLKKEPVVAKVVYHNLASRFEAISKAHNSKSSNIQLDAAMAYEPLQITFNRLTFDHAYAHPKRLVNLQHKSMEDAYIPNCDFSYASSASSSPSMCGYDVDIRWASNSCPTLDEQAILDHERMLYEDDYMDC